MIGILGPAASFAGRRYASQLAIRSALRFFAALKNSVWPSATAAQRWAKTAWPIFLANWPRISI
ncbi:hypothetical protein SapgrDRAFT_2551 [Saprospira grandis DSM 2844]|uniref:Uncharacterized protein n=1 Tax=Saprospira grandis DSM 2844 TaxID=694433 RepID=J1I626_9BACT|nr:hypothetical protein SapgrDRAFT_2551 [Saprospira grandis DSM 2844]